MPAVSYQPPDAIISGVLDEGIRADSLAHISKNTTNSRSFVVHVSEVGLYFCNFWMLPYISADGVSHVYEVYVNGERIGSISPKKSGWQSLCVDGIPRLQSLTDQDNARQTNLSYIDDFKIKYEISSSAEMQGLTWKRTRTLGEIPFEFTVDIPQSGYYMLKLRSKYNDALCTAIVDLSVKGADSDEWKSIGHYVDAILSYSYEDCVVPAMLPIMLL